jgi:Fe-S-cluster containining protein
MEMRLENIKNVCVKCRAKCCYFGGPTMTKQEKERILKAGFKDYFIPCREYFDVRTKKGKCPYLKNSLCSIHDVRPDSCKVWPVFAKIVGGKRKYMLFNCPLTPHLSKNDILKLKKLASKLPDRFYELSWEGNMPPHILKKIDKFRPVPLEK